MPIARRERGNNNAEKSRNGEFHFFGWNAYYWNTTVYPIRTTCILPPTPLLLLQYYCCCCCCILNYIIMYFFFFSSSTTTTTTTAHKGTKRKGASWMTLDHAALPLPVARWRRGYPGTRRILLEIQGFREGDFCGSWLSPRRQPFA